MPHLIVRITVQEFSKWKKVYDSNLLARQSAGLARLSQFDISRGKFRPYLERNVLKTRTRLAENRL